MRPVYAPAHGRTLASASSMIVSASLSSSWERMRGGARRSVLGPADISNSPRSRAFAITCSAGTATSTPMSIPPFRPLRISFTRAGWAARRRCRPASSARDTASMRSRNAGAEMMSNTALATAHASGLPPNVVPWSPALMCLATRSFTSTAPMGRPFASGFASVTMSGCRPGQAKWAKSGPVRARPVCTSSMISTAPTSAQRCWTASRNSCVAGRTPPSPWTVSTMTPAVLSSIRA
mmetsp:Transcript_13544/g.34567  ORF Transcript_13544/g.34567 Transcript_13544/m.34567 type:complete len:236 (+) Transcript_13544:195-902(+)